MFAQTTDCTRSASTTPVSMFMLTIPSRKRIPHKRQSFQYTIAVNIMFEFRLSTSTRHYLKKQEEKKKSNRNRLRVMR
jgi:hypothetical protein